MNQEYTFISPQKNLIRYPNHIEGYQIISVLGKGGFGVVYRAKIKQNQTSVAIKTINKKQMKDANLTKRVANEVEIHWQLRHQNILELYNYFEDSTYVYLIMELCENGTLFQYLKERKCLSEDQSRNILNQLVNGLLYLHSNGIIHRDLKLSNLLLTENYTLKLADFGLAVKLMEPESEQKTMYAFSRIINHRCGTPNYISPEIVSRLPYGLASDVWSFGCMMVTLLTGSPPFQSAEVKSTLEKVTKAVYTLPSHLSKEAQDLISQTLQKDPKKRLVIAEVCQHPFFNPNITQNSLNSSTVTYKHNYESPMRNQSTSSVQNREERKVTNSPSIEAPNSSKRDIRSQNEFSGTPHRNISFNSPLAAAISSNNYVDGTNHSTSNVHNDQLRSLLNPGGNAVQKSKAGKMFPLTLEPIPNFTTVRLRPLVQNTKHGRVEILGTGELLLDFTGDAHLILIAGNEEDGHVIRLFDKNTFKKSNLTNPDFSYTISSLPEIHQKKIRYARKFVDLVRMKTPKIIFYSPQAKCSLMENLPTPDFDLVFYDGIRAHTFGASKILEIKVPSSLARNYRTENVETLADGSIKYTFNLGTNDASSMEPKFVQIFKHAQDCLRNCFEIEEKGKKDPQVTYPMILKSQQTPPVRDTRPNSPPPSVHPSTTSIFTSSIPTATYYDRKSSQPNEQSQSHVNLPTQSKSQIELHQSISNSDQSYNFNPKYLKDVGWCVLTPKGDFSLLFQDGIQLLVNPKSQTVEYFGENHARMKSISKQNEEFEPFVEHLKKEYQPFVYEDQQREGIQKSSQLSTREMKELEKHADNNSNTDDDEGMDDDQNKLEINSMNYNDLIKEREESLFELSRRISKMVEDTKVID
ncbi:hypothetical protein HDV02_005076 [Globomyces sp. JEL0801]|nr:hypothetical protein HDV02_005076 [Globomyces sp. JEL0801]